MKDALHILQLDSVTVAKQLLGWQFYVRETDGTLTGGTLTETEAYNQDDAASHSYRGKTKRNEVMFGPAGTLYVYFTYGMHWCANIVTGQDGRGEAVLIRALLPESNLELIRERRAHRTDRELTNGPAKVCQALGLSGKDNSTQLNHGRVVLLPPKSTKQFDIAVTKRIGIRNDTKKPWRFVAIPT